MNSNINTQQTNEGTDSQRHREAWHSSPHRTRSTIPQPRRSEVIQTHLTLIRGDGGDGAIFNNPAGRSATPND